MKPVALLTVVLMFALYLLSPAFAAEPADVWLDLDTTNGYVDPQGLPHDVDDGLALLFALHSPELHVVGVSAVFGNGPLDVTERTTAEILEKFAPGAGLTAHAGAASAGDLGKETDATRAIEQALGRQPLTLIAVGPVTNVATVLRLHPELKKNVRRVITCAARRPGFGFHPPGRPDLLFPDANFEKDPAGMQALLDAHVPIVFGGYEVSHDVWVTRADLDKLAATNACGAWISKTTQAWMARWESMRLSGFNPFDTLCVGYAIDPAMIRAIPCTAHITTGPDERATDAERAAGKTKPYLICEPLKAGETSDLTYCTGATDRFLPLLLQRLPGKHTAP